MEGCGLDEFGSRQGHVGIVMKIPFPSKLGTFLYRWETVSFWRRTIFYRVPYLSCFHPNLVEIDQQILTDTCRQTDRLHHVRIPFSSACSGGNTQTSECRRPQPCNNALVDKVPRDVQTCLINGPILPCSSYRVTLKFLLISAYWADYWSP